MVKLDAITQEVLDKISEGFGQSGAFNLRQNGISLCHGDSEHIKIKKKEDKPGIDIFIDGTTIAEKVYIPVVVSVSGMTDLVYNDFYIEDGADVVVTGRAADSALFLAPLAYEFGWKDNDWDKTQ
ncbi:MAG: acyclic terpene utilization AtuA family protein [Lachnospiraceae bacterium]|nr:acyclic terpene utilization AtuA family protein [Lachnospiraceae bacterium]